MQKLSTTDLVEFVAQEGPDFIPLHLVLPARPGLPLSLYGRSKLLLSGNSVFRIDVDSLDGRLLNATPAIPLSNVDLLDVCVDPLHFGSFSGLTTKIIWICFGLMVSAMIPIAAVIWYRRTSQSSGAERRSEDGTSRSTLPAYRSRFACWASIVFILSILTLISVCTWMNAPPRLVNIPPTCATHRFRKASHRSLERRVGTAQDWRR